MHALADQSIYGQSSTGAGIRQSSTYMTNISRDRVRANISRQSNGSRLKYAQYKTPKERQMDVVHRTKLKRPKPQVEPTFEYVTEVAAPQKKQPKMVEPSVKSEILSQSVEERPVKKHVCESESESHGSSSEERDPSLKQQAILRKLSLSIGKSMSSKNGSVFSSPKASLTVSPAVEKKSAINLEINNIQFNKKKIENTSKLDISDYLINKTFRQMTKFLKKLALERSQSNPVADAINKAAKKCQMNLFSEQEVEDLKEGLKLLVERRLSQKRVTELGGGDLPCCHIARNNQKFRDKATGMIKLPKIVNNGKKTCIHTVTEEEIFGNCVDLYKKFINFKQILYRNMRFNLNDENKIEARIRWMMFKYAREHMNDLEQLTNDKIVLKLLRDPLVDLVDSYEEMESKETKLVQESPKRQRNFISVVDHSQNLRSSSPQKHAAILQSKIQNNLSEHVMKELKEVEAQSNKLNLGSDWQIKPIETDSKQLENYTQNQMALDKLKEHTSIRELVKQNLKRDATILLVGDLPNEEALQVKRKMEFTVLINYQVFARLKMIEDLQRNQIKAALEPSWEGYQPLDFEDMTDTELNNRNTANTTIDYTIVTSAKEIIQQSKQFWTEMAPLQELIREKVVKRRPRVTEMSEERSKGDSDESDAELDSPRRNLLNQLEANQRFYEKAKHEVAGNHLPQTHESKFYNACKQRNLLPMPIFKCLNDNALHYHSKKLPSGYIEPICEMIESNEDPHSHILSLWLDDCNMKDEDFANLLKSILNTNFFWPSLQSIFYSNNELGPKTVEVLQELLSLNHWECEDATFLDDVYCLKTLSLNNLSIRQMDMRSLMNCIKVNGKNLVNLNLRQLKLNDEWVLDDLAQFIALSKNIREVSLTQCNLGARVVMTEETGKVVDTGLLKIFEALSLNEGNIAKIDLSGNPITSNISTNSMQKLMSFISEIIEKDQLDALDLSGMQLGSYTVELLPSIKQNHNMSYLNLANNQLTVVEHNWILKNLDVTDPASSESVFQEFSTNGISKPIDMLILSDKCFQLAINEFKLKHLKPDFMDDKCDPAVPNTPSQPTQLGPVQQQMIRAAMMKRIQADRLLAKKLHQEGEVGGMRRQDDQYADGLSYVDQIVVTRQSKRPEMVFNQIQGHRVVPLDWIDFEGHKQWQFQEQKKEKVIGMGGQQGGKVSISQENGLRRLNAQYVSLCIDRKDLDSCGFKRVKDERMIGLLQTYYKLKDLEQTNGLFVFGSATDWKIYAMCKLFQQTSAMHKLSKSEKDALVKLAFDQVNNQLFKDFKGISQYAWPLWKTLLKDEDALQLGFMDQQFKQLDKQDAQEYISDRLYTFCFLADQVGAQSIFVWDASSQNLYFKNFIVEIDQLPHKYVTKRPRFMGVGHGSAMSVVQNEGEQKVNFGFDFNISGLLLEQALISDIQICKVNVTQIFTKEDDILQAIEVLKQNYQTMYEIFQLQVALCQKSSSSITNAHFIKFIQSHNLKAPSNYNLGLSLTRAQFINALLAIYKDINGVNSGMAQFEQYIQNLCQVDENSKYWRVKMEFAQDQQVQDFFNEHSDKLLKVFNASAYTKSCYTGFTMLIAQEMIIDGQLNINKPEPEKPVKKKKKGKKGKKADAPATPKVQGPPPEPTFIDEEIVDELFLLSQHPQVDSPSLQRGSQATSQFKSLDELAEFLYRIAMHVYSETSYSEDEEIPKDVKQMFDKPVVEKLERVLKQAVKAVGLKFE